MSERPERCCEAMRLQVEHSCPDHPDAADCPDQVVGYAARFDEYGLPVRDGGSSSIVIRHCPWCGTALPPSRGDAWFDRLDELGLEVADAPEPMRRYGWWL